ncbi:MAG: hypothetical protein ACO23J_04110 [Candidatus Nanopelagicaceae bacterium]
MILVGSWLLSVTADLFKLQVDLFTSAEKVTEDIGEERKVF